MTRKKNVKAEQPLTTEVVGAKKKSSKRKKAVEEKPVIVQEQEVNNNEPVVQEVAENSQKERDYTIDELMDMLGPDIECEDDTEDDGVSSSEKEYVLEDILDALDDCDEVDDEEETSDEIIDMFDKELEAKGLGDAYFDRLEREIKEHEEIKVERELYIDEVLNEE